MDNLYDGDFVVIVKDKKGKEKKFKRGKQPDIDSPKLRSSDDPKFMGDMAADKDDTPYITRKKKINLDAIVGKALDSDQPESKYITKKKKEYITRKKKSKYITKKDD